jgi:hypothetical protein
LGNKLGIGQPRDIAAVLSPASIEQVVGSARLPRGSQ